MRWVCRWGSTEGALREGAPREGDLSGGKKRTRFQGYRGLLYGFSNSTILPSFEAENRPSSFVTLPPSALDFPQKALLSQFSGNEICLNVFNNIYICM